MRAENLSVAAAFDLSYQDLTAGQQRLFRRLGVHPGTDIDAYAAAALDGTDLATARRHLDGLYDQYLLTEPARGRYRLHDLLREHARALAFAGDPADADAAAGRLLDYYLHTAAAAGQHIATRNTAVGRPPPGDRPAVAPPLSTAGQASAWLEAERANLHAAAGLRRRERAAWACHRHPRRDQRLPVRPGSLGPVRRPAPGAPWPPRARPGTGPGRPVPSTSWASCSG